MDEINLKILILFFVMVAKGKKWRSKVVIGGKEHVVSHGDPRYTIAPGTARGDSYCARSQGIINKYGKTPRNIASRRKWKCVGKKSMK
jgi:hypothetical protein